jgi:hypothetical protein
MRSDRRRNDVLGWVAVAVPGIFAGLGWAATDGWPLANRVVTSVAAALVVYAALHWLLKGLRRNGD